MSLRLKYFLKIAKLFICYNTKYPGPSIISRSDLMVHKCHINGQLGQQYKIQEIGKKIIVKYQKNHLISVSLPPAFYFSNYSGICPCLSKSVTNNFFPKRAKTHWIIRFGWESFCAESLPVKQDKIRTKPISNILCKFKTINCILA